ncbi:basic blue protein-like [Capsella rubella]|uniref:basic blue protein-like n=1 Tax=Capsella rubella TaxID=81985 RepID=UPI000CD5C7A9|nr:basic blue protein-like [Capsella rubella]
MANGKNKNMVLLVTTVACLLLSSQLVMSYPAFFHVSWGLGVSLSITFKAGDYLVFTYDKTKDNVIMTTKRRFDTCNVLDTSPESKGEYNVLDVSPAYTGGYGIISLPLGTTYFISTMPGRCALGVKLAIRAI